MDHKKKKEPIDKCENENDNPGALITKVTFHVMKFCVNFEKPIRSIDFWENIESKMNSKIFFVRKGYDLKQYDSIQKKVVHKKMGSIGLKNSISLQINYLSPHKYNFGEERCFKFRIGMSNGPLDEQGNPKYNLFKSLVCMSFIKEDISSGFHTIFIKKLLALISNFTEIPLDFSKCEIIPHMINATSSLHTPMIFNHSFLNRLFLRELADSNKYDFITGITSKTDVDKNNFLKLFIDLSSSPEKTNKISFNASTISYKGLKSVDHIKCLNRIFSDLLIKYKTISIRGQKGDIYLYTKDDLRLLVDSGSIINSEDVSIKYVSKNSDVVRTVIIEKDENKKIQHVDEYDVDDF